VIVPLEHQEIQPSVTPLQVVVVLELNERHFDRFRRLLGRVKRHHRRLTHFFHLRLVTFFILL
jgi:hypothetical protein